MEKDVCILLLFPPSNPLFVSLSLTLYRSLFSSTHLAKTYTDLILVFVVNTLPIPFFDIHSR